MDSDKVPDPLERALREASEALRRMRNEVITYVYESHGDHFQVRKVTYRKVT